MLPCVAAVHVTKSNNIMRLIRNSLLLVVCLLAIGSTIASEPKFTSIFDGMSLRDWSGDTQHWRVEEGAITGEIPRGETLRNNQFLFYANDVHDFELELEYRIEGDASANSGIQFRSQQHENGGAAGYQADLDHGATWLGRIYDEHGRELLVERGTRVSIAPDGRRWTDKFAEASSFTALPRRDGWNKYQIRAMGPHVEVWINGRLCSVLDDHEQKAAEHSGKLGLQLHSGPGPVKVQFRNIRLKNMGRTELPVRPASSSEQRKPPNTKPRALAPAAKSGDTIARRQSGGAKGGGRHDAHRRVSGGADCRRAGRAPADCVCHR